MTKEATDRSAMKLVYWSNSSKPHESTGSYPIILRQELQITPYSHHKALGRAYEQLRQLVH
jgi:hypothetical protein